MPLLLGTAFLASVDVAGKIIAIAALAYLAALGLRLLITRHWLGCLALLLLPYSLVFAGAWSLVESLKNWGHAATLQK